MHACTLRCTHIHVAIEVHTKIHAILILLAIIIATIYFRFDFTEISSRVYKVWQLAPLVI